MTSLRLSSAAVALVLTASPAAAQRDTPAPAARTATIRGQVVAADTGAPIRDATVTLQPPAGAAESTFILMGPGPRPPSVRVDGNGRFELRDVPPGRYRALVAPGQSAARYVTSMFPDPSAQLEPLVVAAGQTLEGLVLAASPGGAITGRVVTEHGDPVAGVLVSAMELRSGGREGPGTVRPGMVRTDDLGMFRVYGLPAGQYRLLAQPDPIVSMQTAAMRAANDEPARPPTPTRTYFPAASNGREPEGLPLTTGQQYGPVEIVLGPNAVSIRGVVLDPNGSPVMGAQVALYEPSERSAGVLGGMRSVTSGRDGSFELRDVAPGEHVLQAGPYSMNPDDGGQQQVLTQVTVGTDDIEGLTLALRRPARITGRVVFQGTSPISSSAVRITARPPRTSPSGPSPTTVEPAADRTFTIENQFSPVLIRTQTPPGWILKSVHHDGRDITDEVTEFARGGPPIEVVLTDSVASLSGKVTLASGAPIEASVVIFPEDPKLWPARVGAVTVVASDSTGAYRATDLRPGRYYVIAVPGPDRPGANAPPSFFELLARDAHPVTLNANQGESVNLRLTRFD